ncbi:Zn-ribbon domain-containing OB-fold protein [Novosphingobium tardum]|jgi:uncharacterized OB-fold protein|uniref:Zn-ribbon domain-containing OB-fold protein n=1 Tax=Novosphingobium tardum TaxID=1538021 RepID=A0ABV8RSY6_9SPHN
MARKVAEGLFHGEGDSTRLLAGRHRETGRLRFPLPTGPDREYYDEVELSPRGKLWSYTIQRFRPKTPFNGRGDDADFKPYGVGYVELPGELIVESRLVANDLSTLKIGQPMHITTEAYRDDENGPVLTYAFAPDGEESRA